ncbi:MAG: MutS-related protein [Lachnospiraceae bacterium]|jgi:DNA mismatch repair ATPase MutS
MTGEIAAYIILIGIVAAVLVYRAVTRKSRLRKRYLGEIVTSWGSLPQREYKPGELDMIARYYENTKGSRYTIDDITWNDLDLDLVYSQINNCRSSCGDDVLYRMLRQPLLTGSELKKRRDIIEYFRKEEKIRVDYQLALSQIGFTKKYAMIDYVKTISSVVPESNVGNYLQLLLYPACIILTVIQPATGIVALIAALIYNIYTYFKTKSTIEPYFVTVGAIAHLVSCTQDILKLNPGAEELAASQQRMKEAVKTLSAVSRGSKFLGTSTAAGTSMGSAVGDYVNMFLRLDLIKFNRLIALMQKHKAEILTLMEETGTLDACISMASYEEMLPFCCEADLAEAGTGSRSPDAGKKGGDFRHLHAENMYHVLLKEPVANSINTDKPVLLTGSNASGKSTFLKTVAISQILAQVIGIAPAKEYHSGFYRIYTSMALKDNLQEGESYFIVEIKSLKRIMDACAEEGAPVMCFIDEVLRGTNTVERIAASSRILQKLSQDGVFCFAATHDVELTQMLEGYYANYHFTEEVKDDDVIFNYRLYEGCATTRNAIKLLGILGYDPSVIQAADETAKRFLEKGEWSL